MAAEFPPKILALLLLLTLFKFWRLSAEALLLELTVTDPLDAGREALNPAPAPTEGVSFPIIGTTGSVSASIGAPRAF